MSNEFVERFHRHLDQCQQCRERPFDLCELGTAYIELTASQIVLDGLRERIYQRAAPTPEKPQQEER